MDKKVAYAVGLILAICILLLVLAPNTKAQTHPTWIGEDLTTGTTDVLVDGTTPSVTPITSLQVIETTSWVGTFWGRDHNGDLVRVCPMYGASSVAADTTIAPPVGAYFIFPATGIEEIRTVSGTATFWGE